MIRVSRQALLQAAALFFSATLVSAQPQSASPAADLPLDQIVAHVQEHAALQSKELNGYVATRHYKVQYKGYATSISAEMVVEVHFDRSSGKSFRIISQNGSKLLNDKVLKKALESEKEAAQDQNSTALSPANYKFELTGKDALNGRPAYVLYVDPLQPGKFLYRGKVWIDAADFAIAKIEVEPSKNPSFWISHSKIENTYGSTEGVWLPQSNRSESRMRVGGAAVLTIDYGTYHVDLAANRKAAQPLAAIRTELR